MANPDYQRKKNENFEKKLIKYMWQCIFSEGSKILLFSIFFWKWQLFGEFVAALFFLLLLRTNGGGLHCKHYVSCFLLSFLMLSGSIFLAINITVPFLLSVFIILISTIIGYWLVPITSSNRPPATNALIKKSKQRTLFILIGFLIVMFILPNCPYIHIGFWTITLHISQLLTAKLISSDFSELSRKVTGDL